MDEVGTFHVTMCLPPPRHMGVGRFAV